MSEELFDTNEVREAVKHWHTCWSSTVPGVWAAAKMAILLDKAADKIDRLRQEKTVLVERIDRMLEAKSRNTVQERLDALEERLARLDALEERLAAYGVSRSDPLGVKR